MSLPCKRLSTACRMCAGARNDPRLDRLAFRRVGDPGHTDILRRAMIRVPDAPSERAARTYTSLRTESTEPRVMRAKIGV